MNIYIYIYIYAQRVEIAGMMTSAKTILVPCMSIMSCVCVCMRMYANTYICICDQVCVCTYPYICIYVCMRMYANTYIKCMRIHIRTYLLANTYIHTYMSRSACEHTSRCICVRMQPVYMYTYIGLLFQKSRTSFQSK